MKKRNILIIIILLLLIIGSGLYLSLTKKDNPTDVNDTPQVVESNESSIETPVAEDKKEEKDNSKTNSNKTSITVNEPIIVDEDDDDDEGGGNTPTNTEDIEIYEDNMIIELDEIPN